MAKQDQDDQKSLNSDDGGETGDKKTTSKDDNKKQTPEEIAENYRKRAENAEGAEKYLKSQGYVKDDKGNWSKPNSDSDKNSEDKNKINNSAQTSDPVELAKMANALSGLSDDEIAQLTTIAKAKNISLGEAKKDPLFSAWYDQQQEKAKKEKAKRGASRGSSQGDEDKVPEGIIPDIHKPLDEQRKAHMDAAKKAMGR